MNGKMIGVILAAVAAAGLVAFLMLGEKTGVDENGDEGDGTTGTLDGNQLGGTDTDDGAGKGENETDGPILFGTEGAHLKGPGDLLGQVMDFATKEPVAGCTVRLSGKAFNRSDIEETATTNKEGGFQFQGIPAGRDLTVEVQIDGATARTLADVRIVAKDVTDVGVLYIGDGGQIEGVVLDANDAPIVGATVQIMPGAISFEEMGMNIGKLIEELDRDPPALAKAETTTKGRFAAGPVAPGRITVVARAPGYGVAVRQSMATPTGAAGGPITMRLSDAKPIKGQVVDVNGGGIGGARVAFMDQSDSETGFYARQFVETDGSGYFSVDSPPEAKRLMAIVAAEGYPTLVQQVDPEKGDPRIVLEGGARVTLRFASTDRGEPIVDAHIVAMFSKEKRMGSDGGNLVTGVTDSAGRVEVQAQPGYLMMLFFRHDEVGTNMFMPQMGGMGMGQNAFLKGPKDTEVKKGSNSLEFEVPIGVTIKGRVTDEGGAPLAGVQLGMAGFGIGGGSKSLTAEDGTYVLKGAMRMPMLAMRAKRAGYVQDPKTMQVKMGTEADGDVVHDVVMRKAATVVGRVVNAEGEAIGGAEVRLEQVSGGSRQNFMGPTAMMGGDLKGIANSKGEFRIQTVMPDQEYRAMARAQGYVVAAGEKFRVSAAETTDAGQVVLRGGTSVVVEVLGPDGRSVSGATVEVNLEPKDNVRFSPMDQWRSFTRGKTDGQGRFTIKDLPPGKITVTASFDDYATTRAMRQVGDGADDSALEVRMTQAQALRGVVNNQDGPVEGAFVSVSVQGTNPDGSPLSMPGLSGRTKRDGTFEIKGAPIGGTMRVSIFADAHRHFSQELQEPYDDIRIELVKIDPELQARIDALQAQLMPIYQQMGSAKTDEERMALNKQAQELQQQIQELQAQASGR